MHAVAASAVRARAAASPRAAAGAPGGQRAPDRAVQPAQQPLVLRDRATIDALRLELREREPAALRLGQHDPVLRRDPDLPDADRLDRSRRSSPRVLCTTRSRRAPARASRRRAAPRSRPVAALVLGDAGCARGRGARDTVLLRVLHLGRREQEARLGVAQAEPGEVVVLDHRLERVPRLLEAGLDRARLRRWEAMVEACAGSAASRGTVRSRPTTTRRRTCRSSPAERHPLQ